jgi:DNA-binding transcriptional ArsR family regulator
MNRQVFEVKDHASIQLSKMLGCADEASELIKGMSNEYRLLILCHLAQSEHAVCELQKKLNMKQAVLSQHLAILRDKNLVKTRREAQSVHYSIGSDEALQVIELLYKLFCDKKDF